MQFVPKGRARFAAAMLTAVAILIVAAAGVTTSHMPRRMMHELRALPGAALELDSADAAVRHVRIHSIRQRRDFTCGEARASIYAIWRDKGVINTYCFAFVTTQGYTSEWLVISPATRRRYHVGKVQLNVWYTDMVW